MELNKLVPESPEKKGKPDRGPGEHSAATKSTTNCKSVAEGNN